MARCERSRKTEFAILQRLSTTKQCEIASFMGVSEPTVSRTVASVAQISDFLAALGMKAVPETFECVNPERMQALKYFARIGIAADSEDTESKLWPDD